MKLGLKIIFSFIFIILLLGTASITSTSYILEKRMEHDLRTSEVYFAKSLANRIFKATADKNNLEITDMLFDEKKLREEKIEYLMVVDDLGYILAHTYLSIMPKQIQKLDNSFEEGEEFEILRMKSDDLFIYDVRVPVMEGIKQVGTIHVGYKGAYLESIKKDLVKVSIIVTSIITIFAIILAILISHLIVNPLLKLTEVANKISQGSLDIKMPEIKTDDEIKQLGEGIKGVLAAVEFLTDEVTKKGKGKK